MMLMNESNNNHSAVFLTLSIVCLFVSSIIFASCERREMETEVEVFKLRQNETKVCEFKTADGEDYILIYNDGIGNFSYEDLEGEGEIIELLIKNVNTHELVDFDYIKESKITDETANVFKEKFIKSRDKTYDAVSKLKCK